MGGNPGADGNTHIFPSPPTEHVPEAKLALVEAELIAPFVEGQRDWSELFRAVLSEEYDVKRHNIDRMVALSLQRLKNGYVPVRVMEMYREQVAFNERTQHK